MPGSLECPETSVQSPAVWCRAAVAGELEDVVREQQRQLKRAQGARSAAHGNGNPSRLGIGQQGPSSAPQV